MKKSDEPNRTIAAEYCKNRRPMTAAASTPSIDLKRESPVGGVPVVRGCRMPGQLVTAGQQRSLRRAGDDFAVPRYGRRERHFHAAIHCQGKANKRGRNFLAESEDNSFGSRTSGIGRRGG